MALQPLGQDMRSFHGPGGHAWTPTGPLEAGPPNDKGRAMGQVLSNPGTHIHFLLKTFRAVITLVKERSSVTVSLKEHHGPALWGVEDRPQPSLEDVARSDS